MARFKVGDVLGLSPNTSHETYTVTCVYTDGTYEVISKDGHSSISRMTGFVLCSGSTHLYKVGDIVQWQDYNTQYEIVRLYEEQPHYYDFKSEENVIYEHMMASAKETYLISSGNPSSQIPEKCKWATPQPLDVEPMYYRIYGVGRPTMHQSTASQHESIQALVVKRTQSSIRLVPPCNLTGDPINIIGKSVQEDDRWKAEAFLQCMECSK